MARAGYHHERLTATQTFQVRNQRRVLVRLLQPWIARADHERQRMKPLVTVALNREQIRLFRGRVRDGRPVVAGGPHRLTRDEDSAAVAARHERVSAP